MESDATTSSAIPCYGWWEEKGWGRQLMLNLHLQFDSGKISGFGNDIIGPFTFAGTIKAQGQVFMVKRYLGMHTVEYVGNYDGEGLLWGEWRIEQLKDKWMIQLKGAKSAAAHSAIEELA